MAKTTITHITDDLDGSKDATEVHFAYDGVEYVIDLSTKNKTTFDKVMKPYVAASTKVPRKPIRSSAGKSNKRDLAAIRTWAGDQGLEVSARGRIAASVVEAYEQAH